MLTTTNGTRLLLAAASRCDLVLVGSLLNLDAVVTAAATAGNSDDVAVLCAGVLNELAMDDAFVAGRMAAALGGKPRDSAVAAMRLAATFATNEEGLGASQSARNLHAAASTRTSSGARERACSTSFPASRAWSAPPPR